MVANPSALEMYWIDGQPYQGIPNQNANANTTMFWVDGDAVFALNPPSGSNTFIQTDFFLSFL